MADPEPNPDDPPAGPAPKPEDPPPAPPPDETALNDAGRRALDVERAARKRAEDALSDEGKAALSAQRSAEKRARKLEAELEKLRQEGLSEQERAIEEAKNAGAAEASAKYAALIVAAEIKAAAASKVAPEAIADLPRLLDLDPTELVRDDGTVDSNAISSAIDEAVTARPFLAATASKNGAPDPDQGARSGGRPTQLTRDALKNMTPDEISKARRDGQLEDLMAGRG